METPQPSSSTGTAELKLDEGYFAARDDLRLYWRSCLPREAGQIRAHLAFVHGYADHSGRYREPMEALARRGFAAHAFDFRGHGQSDGRRVHCGAFSEYLDDLEAFLEHVRGSAEDQKVFLLGHSLGGLICARWALGRREGVAGLVLDAPFLALAFRPSRPKLLAARLLDRLVPWLPISNGLRIDQLTRDLDLQRATERDPLYQHRATPRWFVETERAQEETLRRGSELSLPCLVYAGECDPIADLATTRRFFETLASPDKSLKIYQGMLHEPLNEIGREQVYADLAAWVSARL